MCVVLRVPRFIFIHRHPSLRHGRRPVLNLASSCVTTPSCSTSLYVANEPNNCWFGLPITTPDVMRAFYLQIKEVFLWDIRASHGRQLVAVWFSYGFTYVFAYFRGDFVVYMLGYFVVSPHVAFATDVNHSCHSLRLRTAPQF